jgi:cystathionine beta-lyase family protein involved in aluminum resistance
MKRTIKLEIDPHDLGFIKKAIKERTENILDYIDFCMEEFIEESEEIRDIEIDNFKSNIEEMIQKHQPKRVGRPKGSKNAK